MNLRVDLILETERRSASPVSVIFIVRMCVFTLLAILVLTGLFAIKNIQDASTELQRYEANLAEIRARYEAHLAMKASLVSKHGVLKECKGWENGRMEWAPVFAALQRMVPPSIQLRDVKIERLNSTVNKKPVRVYAVYIKGKATTENAAQDVDKLRQEIYRAPEFTGKVKAEVVIPQGSFKIDNEPNAAKSDRLFELICRYVPVNYE